MAEAEIMADDPPKTASRKPMLLGGVVALLLGAGGFYATWSGLLFGPKTAEHAAAPVSMLPDISFVPVDPLVVSLGPASRSKHLRFSAQLEVEKSHQADVVLVMPRILDVLNGYLRAVEVAELENPSSLVRLRAQMLRRIQMVTGEGRVRDLLITEFVLN